MNTTSGNQPHRRLNRESYRNVHRQILERDGWRCQACGRMRQLEVHHKEFRSQCGEDTEENLISCAPNAMPTFTKMFIDARCSEHSYSIQSLASRAAL